MFLILVSPFISMIGKAPSIIFVSALSFLFSTIRLVGIGFPYSSPPIGSLNIFGCSLKGSSKSRPPKKREGWRFEVVGYLVEIFLSYPYSYEA